MTKYCLANIDELSKEIFQQNKEAGWWDDMDRCVYTCIQLIVTEIAEATEGERKNLMDDHLPHRKMGEVELADALIRTLDLMGRFDVQIYQITNLNSLGFDIEYVVRGYSTWTTPRIHLSLVKACSHLENWWELNEKGEYIADAPTEHFYRIIRNICAAGLALNYDIFGAMEEKLIYNRQRADHKREERAKENGKKF